MRPLKCLFGRKHKEKTVHNDKISESLSRSQRNLEKISNTMINPTKDTKKSENLQEERRELPRHQNTPALRGRQPNVYPDEEKFDCGYHTPYGVFDRNCLHAVCMDVSDKIYFLAGDSKQDLEKKINKDNNIKDVLAVYSGALLYYHERRYIQLD